MRAYEVLEAMVDQHIPEALFAYGVMLLSGFEGQEPVNTREAALYFSKAAAMGYVPAFTALADSFLSGEGVRQSDRAAFQYYLKAAKEGDPAAQFNVGVLYRDGRGTHANNHKAYEYLMRAAKNPCCQVREAALSLAKALK